MPADREAPLRFERSQLDQGPELVRQAPPAHGSSFSASYLAPAGWAYDPPSRRGLALLVSELVITGSGHMRRAELARLLDRHGATLTSDVHPESVEVTLWGPAAHFPALLPVLADAVQRPRFDRSELARLRRQLEERQMREGAQPDRRAEKELLRRLHPERHPYHETGLGTSESVDRITHEDLARFHREHYTAQGGQIVVTHNGPLERLTRRVNAAFHSWPGSGAPPALDGSVARPPRRRSVRLRVPGGSQVEIRLGGAGIARSHSEYPAAYLANELLGGRSLLSRLFRELRERKGLVYHTASSLEAMRWGGYWTAEAGADPKRAPEVERLLLGEIRRVGESPPSPGELDRIRESAIGSVWLELETTATAHELALDAAYHHLPEGFYIDWPSTLRSLRPGDVADAAAELFSADFCQVVMAGPFSSSSDG